MPKELSDEEKLIQAEKEKLEREQAAKKRALLVHQFMQEKLEQERKNNKLNSAKLNAQWRTILRQAKSDELRRDIEILSQTFERVLDRKESVVQSCLNDLKEAEQQELVASRAHVQNLDRLTEFHQRVVEQLDKDFKEELEDLREEFMKEREMLLKRHAQELTELKDIHFSMQMMMEDHDADDESEFASRRDEMRTKNLDAKTTLKATLEGQVKALWDAFQDARRQYDSSTAERRAEFERLQLRDQKAAATIDTQMRRVQKLQDRIAALKQRIAVNKRGTDDNLEDLKREKEALQKQTQELKLSMKRTRERDRRVLTMIATQAKDCEKKLEKKLTSAKQILTLGEVCRKLETEEEKILPFYRETVTREEIEQLEREAELATTAEAMDIALKLGDSEEQAQLVAKEAARALREEEEEEEEGEQGEEEQAQGVDSDALARQEREALPGPTELHAVAFNWRNQRVDTYQALENFWKRYNKVLLDKLAIDREKALLEEENLELRNILKQYLDGISVNENVLAQDNTLLIVNGQTSAPIVVPVGDHRVSAQPPVIEVSHIRSQLRQ